MAPLVRDIMDTDPATVGPEAGVEEVVAALREHEVTGVVVVTGERHLLGIITEDDLVMSGDEGDLHLPHYIELFGGIVFLESMKHFEERLKRATAAKARDMMTEELVTIGPEASATEAGRLIAQSGHNRLPVVEGNTLLGVVTRVDILAALTAH